MSHKQVTYADVSVNHIDFVVDETDATTKHLAYFACGAYEQILEIDITDFVATGFATPTKLDLQTDGGTWDPLFWVEARHKPAQGLDLLYVIGQHWLHCADRTGNLPTDSAEVPHFFGVDPDAHGHVMLEEDEDTGDPREDLWTLAGETLHPWCIWDMTDRALNPGVEAPELLEKHYSPAGTDGAVAHIAWSKLYVPYFRGVVAYDLTIAAGAESATVEPDYDSYQAAETPTGTHVVEHIALGHMGTDDYRLFAPNARGDVLEWELEPTGDHNPGPMKVIRPIDAGGSWGASWAGDPNFSYGHRATFHVCPFTSRPYVITDIARFSGGVDAFLGRYWLRRSGTQEDMAWQKLTLPTGALGTSGYVAKGAFRDVSVSESGEWAYAAGENVCYVIRLIDDSVPFGDVWNPQTQQMEWVSPEWVVWDRFHTIASSEPGFTTTMDRTYHEIHGVASVPGFVILNMKEEGAFGGALVVLTQGIDSGAFTGTVAVLEEASYPEQSVSIDEIPGTDFFGGGPVRTYTLEPDLHRVYAACNYSGAVVEYELDARGTTPTFTHLSTWQDPTHSDQVGDCIPYDVGHASGLPFILVSRFRQTVAILAASGLLP